MHAALEGKVRATYVMGENPMMSDPNTSHVEEALRALDLLIVQDIFPSDTALLAHMILPASSSLEKDGTFTNTERRVQLLNPVITSPGEALPDWQIISEIAKRFDDKLSKDRKEGYWDYVSTRDIFSELAEVTPIYRGISHQRVGDKGIQWPCLDTNHPGTEILHVNKFSRGLGSFSPITAKDPAEQTDEEYPLILTTGRVLYHYHSGTMTRRSERLAWKEPGGYVEINPSDAIKYHAVDNQAILITSRRGSVRTRVKISPSVPEGTIFLAFHWREAPANILTQDHTLDPVAKIPEYKVCAVRIENPRYKG
jgi:predicted molibdopterin-dependent oxidoreductase YjgC